MLEPSFRSQISDFQKRKVEELQAAIDAAKLPGLQASITDRATTFILRYSIEGFEDYVIIGRAPRAQIQGVVIPRNPAKGRKRDLLTSVIVPEEQKMATKRKIDVAPQDVAKVIAGWRRGVRAVETLSKLAEARGQDEKEPG